MTIILLPLLRHILLGRIHGPGARLFDFIFLVLMFNEYFNPEFPFTRLESSCAWV